LYLPDSLLLNKPKDSAFADSIETVNNKRNNAFSLYMV